MERPKIDVKTNGSLLEIGFDFERMDPAEVDQVLKALVGQKDYFVSHTGKVLVFDEETKKISRALADLRAKMSKVGNYKPPGLPLISYLICWQIKTMFIFRRLSKFSS